MVVAIDPEDGKVEGKLHRSGECLTTCNPFAAWSPDQPSPKAGPVSPGAIDVSPADSPNPRDQVMLLPPFVGLHRVVEAPEALLQTGYGVLQTQGHRVPVLAAPPEAPAS